MQLVLPQLASLDVVCVLLLACEAIRRGNVANGAVQTNRIVIMHILRNSLLGFVLCRRAARTNALALE